MKRYLPLLLLAIALPCATLVAQTPPDTQNPALIPVHRLGLPWWKMRLAEKEAQAQQQHDTVLLGDSITHNWDVIAPDLQQHYFGAALNLGFSGDRTQEVLWRINRISWDIVAPKRIMVMIGTNNTGHNPKATPEETFAGIQAIVTTLQEKCPQATITLLSIFPRGVDGNDPKRRTNDAINKLIPTLANGTTIRHMDISSCYLAPDGHTLRRDLLPDLLHPNKEGHRLWGEAVVKPFMQSPSN